MFIFVEIKKNMDIKHITILFSFLLIHCYSISAQDNIKETLRDTMAFTEENTEKVIAFGKFIEASIHENNPDNYNSKFNSSSFFNTVFTYYPDIKQGDEFVVGFTEGLKQSLVTFPNRIISEVENGSYYDFINFRYDYESQTYYALFRLYSLESGMNYHDYKIIKHEDEIQFSDMYIYVSGENLAQTIGRLLNYSLPETKKKGRKKNFDMSDDSKTLYKAIMENKSGLFKKAYHTLERLDSELSKDKFVLIFKSMIASQVDEPKYLQSLEELITTLPDDPTLALNKIDYHIMKEEYFEAIQVINQLQNETEDDFLNYLKGAVAFQDGNYDLAFNMFSYTIENYPGFFDGQIGYLNVVILMKNYSDAVNYLDTLLEEGYEKPFLITYLEEEDETGENILESFTLSEEYKSWKLKED
jgi:tetratricopeptide (TPR) repeat protein